MSEPELFKDFTGQDKKRWHFFKKSTGPFYPAKRKFTISYEAAALWGIVFIIILVITFAMGVNRGRLIYSQKQGVSSAIVSSLPSPAPTALTDTNRSQGSVEQQKAKEPVFRPLAPVSTTSPAPKAVKAPSVLESYTIQLVTYTSPNTARQACEGLKQKGYSPFVIISGKYYQVCVGNYKSRADAEKDLPTLNKLYKGSLVRKFKKNKEAQ